MAILSVTREVVLGDLTVTVKELTISEIRAWLKTDTPDDNGNQFDLVTDLLSFDGIGMIELCQFSTLTRDQAESLPLSAIQKVAAVIKEINSVFFFFFFPAINRLLERLESTASNDPSAP